MKKTLIIMAIALFLAGLLAAQMTPMKRHVPSTPAEQYNPSFRDRMTPMDNMMNCKEELKLTEDQAKKLETLHMNFQKSMNTLQAEMENLHMDITAALKDENYKQAKELTKQLMAKKSIMAENRIDFMANRMKELTPEQKKIMLQQIGQFKQHGMNDGMGMMNGKGHMGNCQGMGCGNHQAMGNGMGQDNCQGMGQGMGKDMCPTMNQDMGNMNPTDKNSQTKEK